MNNKHTIKFWTVKLVRQYLPSFRVLTLSGRRKLAHVRDGRGYMALIAIQGRHDAEVMWERIADSINSGKPLEI